MFEVGDVLEAGAGPHRKNAARLEILAIEDEGVGYKSLRRPQPYWIDYSHLELLVSAYDPEQPKPKSITNYVNERLKEARYKQDYKTETYAYSLAKALYEKQATSLFLSQGETVFDGTSNSDNGKYLEGGRVAVLVERSERCPEARRKCIEHYGAQCQVCDFHFEKRYGSVGKGFIHVHHHRIQLAKIRRKHKVDPIKDLIPVCPNCHAMIHSKRQMLPIAKLKQIIRKCTTERGCLP